MEQTHLWIVPHFTDRLDCNTIVFLLSPFIMFIELLRHTDHNDDSIRCCPVCHLFYRRTERLVLLLFYPLLIVTWSSRMSRKKFFGCRKFLQSQRFFDAEIVRRWDAPILNLKAVPCTTIWYQCADAECENISFLLVFLLLLVWYLWNTDFIAKLSHGCDVTWYSDTTDCSILCA